MTLYAV